MGHRTEVGADMGDVHAIMIDQATGLRLGASDPRLDGRTLGYLSDDRRTRHGPADAAPRLRRHRADSPASLPVPAGGSHHRVRARPAHCRHQERVVQRAVRWRTRPTAPVLPPTILTEAVAQVGAILILSKPENREKLPFFMGIAKVRYRQPVRPGDVVEIEAVVKRLRSRVGHLQGVGTRQWQGRRRRHDDVRARARAAATAGNGRDVQGGRLAPLIGRTRALSEPHDDSTAPTFSARDAHAAHRASGLT